MSLLDDHNKRYMFNVGNAAVFSRRRMLERSCLGFGSMVLADLLKADAKPSSGGSVYSDLAARSTHFPAKAKAVIQLVQNGGPSQMDLFDPKPELTRRAGQPHPDGVEIHQPGNLNTLLASPFEFRRSRCRRERSVRVSIIWRSSTARTCAITRVNPNSRRGSITSSWLLVCNWRRETSSISPRKPKRPKRCTAWITPCPPTTA